MPNEPKDLQKTEPKESFVKTTTRDTISKTISTVLAAGILGMISALIIFLYGLPLWLYLPVGSAVFFFICLGLFLYGKFKTSKQIANLKPESEKEEIALLDNRQVNIIENPNIVNIPKLVILEQLELDGNIFRFATSKKAKSKAIVFYFENKPNPPERVIGIDNVRAQISFFKKGLDMELIRINNGCWVNSPLPNVSFPVNQTHCLVIGVSVIEKKIESNRKYKIFDYSNELHKPISNDSIVILDGDASNYIVKVTLIPDNEPELSRVYLFDLHLTKSAIISNLVIPNGITYKLVIPK